MYVPVEAVTQLRICEEGVDERTDRQTNADPMKTRGVRLRQRHQTEVTDLTQ
jgi:hypothetical protein